MILSWRRCTRPRVNALNHTTEWVGYQQQTKIVVHATAFTKAPWVLLCFSGIGPGYRILNKPFASSEAWPENFITDRSGLNKLF